MTDEHTRGRTGDGDLASPAYRGDLGGGLVRRWSTAADIDRVARLFGSVFREAEDGPVNPRPMQEALLFARPDFPFGTAEDVAVVEDTSRPDRPIVAATWFWRHRWTFAGIPFGVTRPEMVATDAAYRRRGLVRAVFEMVHARGAAEGHLLSAITGISYFYRQFGYEYVLDLESGRSTYPPLAPERRADGPEACTLRPATEADIPALAAAYDAGRERSLVWHEAPEGRWRWATGIWDDPAVRDGDPTRVGPDSRLHVMADRAGGAAGYIFLPVRRFSGTSWIFDMAFAPDADLPAIVPSLVRALWEHVARTPPVRPGVAACTEIRIELPLDDPFWTVLGEAHAPRVHAPYAWYIRVPDVPAFLRLIAPVLERRLAASPLRGHTGELRIDLFREALKLVFRRGELEAVEPWTPPPYENDEAALGCPPLTFLHLLLAYRSLAELEAIHPDVDVRDDDRLLITTLFPRERSAVAPLA